jgi:hypothetical protein
MKNSLYNALDLSDATGVIIVTKIIIHQFIFSHYLSAYNFNPFKNLLA